MKYKPQNLSIKIYIPTTNIDAVDRIKIYETTDDPSNGTLLRTLQSTETTINPSDTAVYLFQYTKRIITPDNYSFYYTVIDEAGNESDIVNTFSETICLTPRTPDSLNLTSINTTTNTITFNL